MATVFHIVPTLSVQPISVTAGSPVTVIGTGYGAVESVQLTFPWPPDICLLGTRTTTSAGSFTGLAVTIPPTATVGTYQLSGTGMQSKQTVKVSVQVH